MIGAPGKGYAVGQSRRPVAVLNCGADGQLWTGFSF